MLNNKYTHVEQGVEIMLGGFIEGLIVAWILSWFGVDKMIIDSVRELLNITISSSVYYLAFGLIGLIGGAFKKDE